MAEGRLSSNSARLRRVNSSRLHSGAPYAYATAVAAPTSLAYLAGACPIDETGAVPTDSLTAQADLCVENLRRILAELDCTLDDVVRTTVYVATSDHSELLAAWEAVRAAFGGIDPSSTLVGVSILGYARQLIEVEAVAALPASPG